MPFAERTDALHRRFSDMETWPHSRSDSELPWVEDPFITGSRIPDSDLEATIPCTAQKSPGGGWPATRQQPSKACRAIHRADIWFACGNHEVRPQAREELPEIHEHKVETETENRERAAHLERAKQRGTSRSIGPIREQRHTERDALIERTHLLFGSHGCMDEEHEATKSYRILPFWNISADRFRDLVAALKKKTERVCWWAKRLLLARPSHSQA